MKPSRRFARPAGLMTFVACLAVPSAAPATTYDLRPRQTILLGDGTRFVAQDGPNSVTLYRTDGSVAHRFPAPAEVARIALSPDEKHLLVACEDGSLVVWRVASGERAWIKDPGETGLLFARDASFAGNGERFAVCDSQNAAVFDTRNGGRVGAVSFPPPRLNELMSVALGPDGTDGFLVGSLGGLYSFNLAAGLPVITEFRGSGPVRCSTDGRHVAFPSYKSGLARPSVVQTGEQGRQDFGEFARIGHINAAGDGSFLVSGLVGGPGGREVRYVGVQVWPDDGRVQEVWRFGYEHGVNELTAYDPRSMIGVSTAFNLVTRVTDLRAGKVVRKIDNRANYRPVIISTSSGGDPPGWSPLLWVSAAAFTVLLVAGALLWRLWRAWN